MMKLADKNFITAIKNMVKELQENINAIKEKQDMSKKNTVKYKINKKILQL